MAPRARSTPTVSTAMALALDALSSVLVADHPREEARRLDRVIGAHCRPIHVAPRFGRAAASPLGLSAHLLRACDPDPELLRTRVHPPAGGRVTRVAAAAPVTGYDDRAAAVQPLSVGGEDRDPHRENMAPERAIPLHQGLGILREPLRLRPGERPHAGPNPGAEVGLEQQLGESWGPEHLVGHDTGLRLALEITQALERMGAQQGGAVGRTGGRAVQRRDDVPPRGPPFELPRPRLPHFLPGDELHLAQLRDGLALVRGEEAVLADVDVDSWSKVIEGEARSNLRGLRQRRAARPVCRDRGRRRAAPQRPADDRGWR